MRQGRVRRGSQTNREDSWLFIVYLTRQIERYEPAKAALTVHHVQIPESLVLSKARSSTRSSKLAFAVLNEVRKKRTSGQPDLFHEKPGGASNWSLCFSQVGAVDEFTLGVQAVFIDPSGHVVSLLAMHFPEDEGA
jgi:hypothetical protein